MLLCLLASAQASTFTVINTSDSGAGSLRQAISDANGNSGADTIAFNIPGSGVHTISPLTPLPTVTGPVTIDGYTQPGSSQNTLAVGDNAVLLVEISGALVSGTFTDGLDMFGGSSTIRGLVINHFPEFGINFVFGDPGGNAITAEKIKHGAPDLVVRPRVGAFRALDFLQASAILRAAEPVKVELKEKLGALLES